MPVRTGSPLFPSVRTTMRRLMDGVDLGTVEQIDAVLRADPGVVPMDRVRARWSGHRLGADASIAVQQCNLRTPSSRAYCRRTFCGSA